MKNIRDDIVEKRRARIARLGHAEGADVPAERSLPLAAFLPETGMICEIKRGSPSRGDIAAGLDAVGQASAYVRAGVGNISVLTEPTGFSGSLEDLTAVKKAHPGIAVLRKDFLFDPEDVDVSWRAGADAVLLIAGMLSAGRLEELHRRAKSYGMEVLVELHDHDDVRKAARFRPGLVGVNSRDLVTFAVDPLIPLRVKSLLDWPARVVYESGIRRPEQAAFAVSSGFAGILVGEAAVRDPALPGQLHEAMRRASPNSFWPRLAERIEDADGKPLVKICGLANATDARHAADAGADLLGFVFWERSRRRANPALLRELADVRIPKTAVVVEKQGDEKLPAEITALLENGLLDAVQFHGDGAPEDCARLWPTNYKAIRPENAGSLAAHPEYWSPRTLLDAAADLPGGSGVLVPGEVVDAWKKPLWLAGGLNPENIGAVVRARRPELVDAASGVELSPGRKDRARMIDFIRKARND